MCTSFTYKMKNGANSLSRTMDFSFILNPDAILIPRNHAWKSQVDGTEYRTQYAFTGLGRQLSENIVFADGINEQGLCCAVLYFSGYAAYQPKAVPGATNLAPHEVLYWLLAGCESTRQARKAVEGLNIVDSPVSLLGLTPPFHWIVTDKTGETIVIEPLESGLTVHDNKVGVMSNSPDFPWHMTNIRNYIGLRPYQCKPITIDGVTFQPFGQASGTVGLPGDYTPPARFLRALFGKTTINVADNETDAVTAIFHLLGSVNIPKGSVLKENYDPDFTQHASCMFSESRAYYFRTYDNSQINKIDLCAENLNADEPTVWPIPKAQQIHAINPSQ